MVLRGSECFNRSRQQSATKLEEGNIVSTLAEKFRTRRNAARRARAIERALAHCTSQTMRDEILTIANRDF
jgi:hypothetical protein